MARTTGTGGTDNVLADIGLPDAEELTAKVILAKKINDILASRALTTSRGGETSRPAATENFGNPALQNLRYFLGTPDAGAHRPRTKRRDRGYAVKEKRRHGVMFSLQQKQQKKKKRRRRRARGGGARARRRKRSEAPPSCR